MVWWTLGFMTQWQSVGASVMSVDGGAQVGWYSLE